MSPSISGAVLSIYILLAVLTSIFAFTRWFKGPGKLISELIERTVSWWVIVTVTVVGLFLHDVIATLSLMALSFFCFREIIQKFDLGKDHKKVLRACYIAIPIQYLFAYNNDFESFLVFIPVIMFIYLSLRSVSTGETDGISKTMGVVHWSLMMTVFSLSHIALFYSHNFDAIPQEKKYALILYLILATELNDVFQFTWGKIFGKRKICPTISPKKTFEGFLGGILSTMALSYFLQNFIGATTAQSLVYGFAIAASGFLGDITFSALKRDLKIKDLGSTLPGHGGLLDRVDSLTLTSIAFFYVIKLF